MAVVIWSIETRARSLWFSEGGYSPKRMGNMNCGVRNEVRVILTAQQDRPVHPTLVFPLRAKDDPALG